MAGSVLDNMLRGVAGGLILMAGLALGQEVPKIEESVSVGYVMIPFTVLSEKGFPLTDLRKNEVHLLVDGKSVRSDMFEKSENAPVSFTILLDTSGSMELAGKMDSARAAIGALLAHRRPGDDFSLFVFAETEARELVSFTERPAAIANALATGQRFGATALWCGRVT